MPLRITFYAHACFRLEGSGLSIVTDPYTPYEAGPPPVPDAADVVVMSSALDPAHSCPEQVPGSPRIVNALDAVDQPISLGGGVEVSAVAASEGYDREDPRQNAIYRFTLDGVRICHMGDVGNALTDEQLTPLRGNVDVLFALAGAAGLTIALPDLDDAVEAIGPRVVIPMHYRTPRIRYAVGPLDDFLARHEGEPIERSGSHSIEISPETLPAERTIVVLEPLLG
jgi:L-ascorbate metabolism protein UlaG (beta-lactamase superfamily)